MGCVTLPTQEMSDARQALAAAESVNAGVLAPETYSEAKRMLRSAEKSLRKRNYSLARRDALRAKELAMQARRAALSDEEP
ncbi:MAG: DUF4398 domain-containing protein [Gammaproteobacteria bacterium]|nr:MAG: DUF4398 domain-containing protein [Gammaproteobacteria bacterium]